MNSVWEYRMRTGSRRPSAITARGKFRICICAVSCWLALLFAVVSFFPPLSLPCSCPDPRDTVAFSSRKNRMEKRQEMKHRRFTAAKLWGAHKLLRLRYYDKASANYMINLMWNEWRLVYSVRSFHGLFSILSLASHFISIFKIIYMFIMLHRRKEKEMTDMNKKAYGRNGNTLHSSVGSSHISTSQCIRKNVTLFFPHCCLRSCSWRYRLPLPGVMSYICTSHRTREHTLNDSMESHNSRQSDDRKYVIPCKDEIMPDYYFPIKLMLVQVWNKIFISCGNSKSALKQLLNKRCTCANIFNYCMKIVILGADERVVITIDRNETII